MSTASQTQTPGRGSKSSQRGGAYGFSFSAVVPSGTLRFPRGSAARRPRPLGTIGPNPSNPSDPPNPRCHSGPANAGFTLVEVLVAVGVFVLVVGSVAALFISSVRSARAGQLAIQAQEEVRGAFDVIERDLLTAFTARDYGDYYTFYGTPYGMMFVGLVRGQRVGDEEDRPKLEQDNISRVTYVLRRRYEEFVDPYTGATRIIQSPSFPSPDDPDQQVVTCALLRIVEPGLKDLDSYGFVYDDGTPMSWEDLISGPMSLEYPDIGPQFTWYPTFAEIQNCLSGLTQPPPDWFVALVAQYGADAPEAVRIMFGASSESAYERLKEIWTSTKKRELWLQMLAGYLAPYDRPWVQEKMPDGWKLLHIPSHDVNGLPVEENPDDYIVADNIVVSVSLPGPVPVPRYDVLGDGPAGGEYFRFLQYARVGTDRAQLDPVIGHPWGEDWKDFWNSEENLAILQNDFPGTSPSVVVWKQAHASPLEARLPQAVKIDLMFRFESPFIGASDTIRRMEQVVKVPAGYARSKTN